MTGARIARANPQDAGRVRVWDAGVRLFHWSMVTAVVSAWILIDPRWLHRRIGYVVIGLIVFRLVWGLLGTRHARFTSFIPGPRRLLGYLADMLRGRERRYLGHNPAGAAMIVALLLMLTGISATGIMMGMDRYFGESWVEHLHKLLVDGLLVLVACHLAGVAYSSLRHRENLVAAMIHGQKERHDDDMDA